MTLVLGWLILHEIGKHVGVSTKMPHSGEKIPTPSITCAS
jgi:hypothetical protein